MAITLKGFTAFPAAQRGVELAETGVNVESLEVEYRPEFKDVLPGISGEATGFAVAQTMTSGTISGEVLTATGLMALSFITAHTLANDIDGFGQTGGLVFFESVRIGQSRDGWRTFSGSWTRYAGIA